MPDATVKNLRSSLLPLLLIGFHTRKAPTFIKDVITDNTEIIGLPGDQMKGSKSKNRKGRDAKDPKKKKVKTVDMAAHRIPNSKPETLKP